MSAFLVGDIGYRTGASSVQTDTGGEQTVVFLVQTDNVNEPKANIVAATGFGYFTPNPEDDTKLSQRATVRNHNNEPYLFEVEIFFSSSTSTEEAESADPLDRTTKIRWRSSTYQKFVWKDRNGDPIATTAGELFEDVPGIDDVRWVISVEKNVSSVPTWVLNYENKLNDTTVTVDGVQFDDELLKLQNLDISNELVENKVKYRRLTFDLHYRSDGWKLQIANRGYYERYDGNLFDDVQPIKIPFADESGNQLDPDNPRRRKVSSPYPIDSAGFAIKRPTTSNIHIAEFDVYETADFSVLPGVT